MWGISVNYIILYLTLSSFERFNFLLDPSKLDESFCSENAYSKNFYNLPFIPSSNGSPLT